MLQKFRQAIIGWVAWAIVIALVIPLSLWGVNVYFGDSGKSAVAEVGKVKIYQSSLLDMMKQLSNFIGENEEKNISTIREVAIKQLVNQELLQQFIKEQKIVATDKELARQIALEPAFHDENGAFDPVTYQTALAQAGMTTAIFEKKARDQLPMLQMQSVLQDSIFVSNMEVEAIANLLLQKRDFSYLVIPFGEALQQVDITDEAIQDYYQKHAANYHAPEKVKVEYVSFKMSTLADAVEVSKDVLETYYENNKESYLQKEKRGFEQVKIQQLKQNGDDWDLSAALTYAEGLKDKLDQEGSIEKIVETLPKNPVRGGSLEFSEVASTDGENLPIKVRAMLFSLEKGAVSYPIESEGSVYLFALKSIEKSKQKSFLQTKEQVERDYRQYKAADRFYQLVEEIAATAYEQPDSLEPLALNYQLNVQHSDWLVESDNSVLDQENVLTNPKVRKLIFDPQAIEEKTNSAPIELTSDHVVFVRVSDHQQPVQLPLEEVKERVFEEATRDAAITKVKQQGNAILKEVREEGQSLITVAEKYNLNIEQAYNVDREDPNYNRSMLRLVFGITASNSTTPNVDGQISGSGDFFIVSVKKVHQPSIDSIGSSKIYQPIKSALAQEKTGREWEGLLYGLKQRTKVTIKQSAVDSSNLQ